MAQSITLTASMRSNLASLKTIQGQMDTTQTRLSTGKKVNSAIDNASSFYQSRALTNRAADLDALLDSMGQGIQTIQAANQGIEAVTSYIEQAKSVANSAFALDPTASDYVTQVNNYLTQYNDILKEIGTLAKDSGYQGVNLLTGSNLTVMFNETRTHSLVVQGDTVTNELNGVGASGFAWNASGDGAVAWTTGGNAWATATAATGATHTKIATAAGNALLSDATTVADTAAGYATTVVSGDLASYTTKYSINGTSDGFVEDSSGLYYKISAQKIDTTTGATSSVDVYVKAAALSASHDEKANTISTRINDSLDAIAKGMDYLRDYASELGNNFSIIETRQNFTENLIDVLETGSDNLVLADMNEESANYLALQTRQQLAINSLALASQSAQSVLKLF